MSTLAGRTTTALIVVDVQTAVMAHVHDRSGVISRIRGIVERCRSRETPVVWVQHNDDELVRGSDGWKIVDELTPLSAEPVVHKSYNDAFEQTSLEDELAARSIGSLIVVGAQTEWCIRSTLHGAIARGYDALLVSDAHTTTDMSEAIPATSIIEMTNRYWCWHSVPGRSAGIVTSDEI